MLGGGAPVGHDPLDGGPRLPDRQQLSKLPHLRRLGHQVQVISISLFFTEIHCTCPPDFGMKL